MPAAQARRRSQRVASTRLLFQRDRFRLPAKATLAAVAERKALRQLGRSSASAKTRPRQYRRAQRAAATRHFLVSGWPSTTGRRAESCLRPARPRKEQPAAKTTFGAR